MFTPELRSLLESTAGPAQGVSSCVPELVALLEQHRTRYADAAALEQVSRDDLKKGIAVLASWCRNHEAELAETADVQRAVCALFQALLGRDTDSDMLALNKGMLTCVTDWMKLAQAHRPVAENQAQQLISLATVLSQPRDADKIVQTAGTVKVLLEFLRIDHDPSIPSSGTLAVPLPVLEDAITGIALLMVRSRHKRVVNQNGGIPLIVHLLKQRADLPEIVVAASRFLSNFQDKPEYREVVFAHGGHVALQSAFTTAPQHVKARPDAPFQLLRIRTACVEALWNCVIDNEKVVEVMYMDAFLDVFLPPCLQEYLQQLEESNFYTKEDDLVADEHNTESETEQSAHYVLEKLARLQEQHEMLNSGPPTIDKESLLLLPRLFAASFAILRRVAKSPKCRSICVALPYLDMAQKTLRFFPQEYDLAKEIAGMLGNLSLDPEWRKDVLNMGFVPALVEFCDHAEDRKLAKICFSALANLAHDSTSRQMILQHGIIPVLLRVVHANLRNEIVVEAALNLISHLAPDQVCADELRIHAGVEMLFVVLQEHGQDLQVARRCLMCLRRLAVADVNNRMVEKIKNPHSANTPNNSTSQQAGSDQIVALLKWHFVDATCVKEIGLLCGLLQIPDASLMPFADLLLKVLEFHEHEPEVMKIMGDLVSRLPIADEAL
ncbi:unnamed protein product [Amoebophrya sp. A120]|nr:unnamed protein product [Amoebophrya sp. A120]|eukprot:GSA120T00005249001.1